MGCLIGNRESPPMIMAAFKRGLPVGSIKSRSCPHSEMLLPSSSYIFLQFPTPPLLLLHSFSQVSIAGTAGENPASSAIMPMPIDSAIKIPESENKYAIIATFTPHVMVSAQQSSSDLSIEQSKRTNHVKSPRQ